MKEIFFLVVSSLGICAAIAVYTHLAGFSRRVLLSDEQAARDLLMKYDSNKTIVTLELADDRRAALVVFEDGTGCLLHAMGHKWARHDLGPGTLRAARLVRPGKLHLVFDDYAAPSLNISLGDQGTGKALYVALQPFLRGADVMPEQGI